MHIQELTFLNFKNYKDLQLSFSPKLNCITGNNGVGKTNILDGIYYLSFTKSAFNTIDTQNINHDEPFFMIQGLYERKNEVEKIQCSVKRGQKKSFKRNTKEYNKLSEHIGIIPLVMKSPADTDFIYAGGEERRKFLDSVISQFDYNYLDALLNYNKILTHRNKLLKNSSSAGRLDTFEIYDLQLSEYAQVIYKKRKEFIEGILSGFQEYYDQIGIESEKVNLKYESHLEEGKLEDLLKQSFTKDSILQHTTKGIHRDDLILELNGQAIRKFASQGQQKTFLISLKFAQYQYIKVKTGLKPILLLDDLFDKLDKERITRIIQLVNGEEFGQIFITDTNTNRINELLSQDHHEHKLIQINEDNLLNN